MHQARAGRGGGVGGSQRGEAQGGGSAQAGSGAQKVFVHGVDANKQAGSRMPLYLARVCASTQDSGRAALASK